MAEQPEKKIAIVGFTASKTEAPWDDPTFEKWICNNLWKHCPPSWDRLYDLHDLKSIKEDKEHDAFLRGQKQKTVAGKDVGLDGRPVWCFSPQSEWPTSQQFPQDEINQALGRYFTNSISWMIAHALKEGVTELHIYGVDMATGTEYASQRPSCEYFLGLAAGAGVKVYVPPQSDLLKLVAMYGVEDDSALHAKMVERETELVQRGRQLETQLGQAQTQLAQIQGALETTRYVKEVWTNARADRDGSAKGSQATKDEVVEATPQSNGVPSEQAIEGIKQEVGV